MAYRMLAAVVAVLLSVGCGDGSEGSKLEGREASKDKAPKPSADNPLLKKVSEASKVASTVVEKKEEVKKPPETFDFYVINPAYEASGYQPEALKRKIEENQKAGVAHVKMRSYNGIPESAAIFDMHGNQTATVNYLWTWPEAKGTGKPTVTGAVQLNEERMTAPYPIFYFCKGADALYVHLSTARHVNASFLKKVELAKEGVTVSNMTATNDKGQVAVWPDTCKDLEAFQAAPQAFEIYGIHKQIFGFDPDGNLVRQENQDKDGGLAEDLYGRAKVEQGWKDGRMEDEAFYDKDGLVARYVYTFGEKGVLTKKDSVDAEGKPKKDYFGAAAYEYTYDARNRLAKEVRFDVAGAAYETHEYEYGKMAQVSVHRVLDGAGTLVTTYVHEFNDKGSRLSMSTYEGDPKDAKLKLDYNKVAIYRFKYNEKGEVLEMSRHGLTQIAGVDGKPDYAMTNALDGWAAMKFNHDKEANLESTAVIKVDEAGNPVWEEVTDAKGNQTRIDRTFEGATLKTYTKTTITDGLATKVVHYDAADKVTAVALLKNNDDGRVVEVAYFAEDEKTVARGPEGFHKQVMEYNDMGLLTKKTDLDETGNILKGTVFEYEAGKLKATKQLGAGGVEIPAAK